MSKFIEALKWLLALVVAGFLLFGRILEKFGGVLSVKEKTKDSVDVSLDRTNDDLDSRLKDPL